MILLSPLDKYLFMLLLMVPFGLIERFTSTWIEEQQAYGGFFSKLWVNVFHLLNGDEFLIVVIGTLAVVFIFYWGIGSIFSIVDLTGKPAFLLKYKIQPEKNAPISWELFKQSAIQASINLSLTIPFTVVTYFFAIHRMCADMKLPSFHIILFEMVFNSIMLEILFYYSHRTLHHPILFKYIHKKHHKWTAPVAISFFDVHPIELIFGILIPFMTGSVITKAHITSLWIWMGVAIFIGLMEHSGYHIPFLFSTQFHDFHHAKAQGNFGLIGLMDRIHGTDEAFRQSIAFKSHFLSFQTIPLKQLKPGN